MTQPTEIGGLQALVIKQGLEAELRGFRLTGKAPRCFKIIKEMGFKVNPRNKIPAYEAFCNATNQTPIKFIKFGNKYHKMNTQDILRARLGEGDLNENQIAMEQDMARDVEV